MSANVTEIIENECVGSLQLRVLALTALAIIIDGFDIQAIAFAGPVILNEWGLTRAQLGPAIAAALIGMAIGAPFGGAIGDRFGRRAAIIGSAIFFGFATLATATAKNIEMLSLLRLISGLGFGAMLPNATSLLAEWMPSRHRSYAISLMIIGIPIGGMLGAELSRRLIPAYGWQSCFIVGGALALVLGALLFVGLPESLRFLVRRHDEAVVRRALGKAFPKRNLQGLTFEVEETVKASVAEVLKPAHLRVTLGLSLAFLANLLVAYAFFNWVPTMLTSMGMPLDVAIQGAFHYNLWGLAGALLGGLLVAWRGSRTGLLVILGCAIAVTGVMSYLVLGGERSALPIIVGLSLAGAAVSGLQAALYALAAVAYPTYCRSTGIGVVAGAGRIGAIASAFLGGMVLSLAGGQGLFFVIVAVVLVLAGVGVLLVDRHSPPVRSRSLQASPAV